MCGRLLPPLSGITLTTRATHSLHYTPLQQFHVDAVSTPVQPLVSTQATNNTTPSGSALGPQLLHGHISSPVLAGPTRNVTGEAMPTSLAEAVTQLSFLEFLQRCNLLIAPSQTTLLPAPVSLMDVAVQTASPCEVSQDSSTQTSDQPVSSLSLDVAVQTIFHSICSSSLDAAVQTTPPCDASQDVSTQTPDQPGSQLSFDVAVQTSFHSVHTSSLDASVQTLPHSTQAVSTQMGSRPASSFSIDVTVQTLVRNIDLHDTATQLPLTEFFIGCIFSNDPLDRQGSSSAQSDIGSVPLPPHPDITTTCTLSSSSFDSDDHVRTLAPRFLLHPPPGLEQFAPPPGLEKYAHLCASHGTAATLATLSYLSHAPTASCLYHPCGNTPCALSHYRQEKCWYCFGGN